VQEVNDYDNDKENSSVEGNDESLDHMREYVLKEKSELKELQERLEDDKRRFKKDKKDAEAFKYSEPTGYRQKMQVLDKVKESIENKIDKVNERIAKVKQVEKKLKK
jgi:predicted  nucleic acid-binding Zn-ribbon protein